MPFFADYPVCRGDSVCVRHPRVPPNHVSCAGRTVHYRVTACVKTLNAKFECMRNVKAQIPKLELQDVCFRTKSQNVLWRKFPVLRYNLQQISKERRYCQYLCIA